MVTVKERIKENVRRLRKEKGMTLSEMAAVCDCSPGLLSQIETGSVNPSLSTMVSISEALDTSLSDLFAGAPSKKVLHLT